MENETQTDQGPLKTENSRSITQLLLYVGIFIFVGMSFALVGSIENFASQLPKPPTLATPENGARIKNKPTLRWNKLRGAKSYTLNITKVDDTLFRHGATVSTDDESFTPESLDEGSYQWRVMGEGLEPATSPWSETNTFTLGNDPVENTPKDKSFTSRLEAESYIEGGQGVGFQETTTENLGNGTCRGDSVDLKQLDTVNCAVGWFDNTEWLAYKITVNQSGDYEISTNAANGLNRDSKLIISLNGETKKRININPTGSWSDYKKVSGGSTNLPSGTHDLLISRSDWVDFDWLEFNGPGEITASAEIVGNTTSRIEAEDYRAGGEGVGYHDTSKGNIGDGSCRNDDVDMKQDGDFNCVVGWFAKDEWLSYRITVDKGGTYTLSANIANGRSSSTYFDVELNDRNIAEVAVEPTGSWSLFNTVEHGSVDLASGSHDLLIRRSNSWFDIDWIEFEGPGNVIVSPGVDVPDEPNNDTPLPPTPQPVSITSRVEAESYKDGGEGVGYHESTPNNLGGGNCRGDAVDLKQSGNNNCILGWFDSSEWLAYEVLIDSAGTYELSAKVANGLSDDTSLVIDFDDRRLANIVISPTSDWNSLVKVSYGDVQLDQGTHTLLLRRTNWVDVDWLEFVGPGSVVAIAEDFIPAPAPNPTPPPTPPPTPNPTPAPSSDRGPLQSISCPANSVSISPGQSIQSAVNSNSAGTTYCIKAGIHRGQEVFPKRGDKYIGEYGAKLDGQGTSEYAFLTWDENVDNVVIRNLEITGYDLVNSSHAAIYGTRGTGWEVSNCEIHHNRYSGAYVGEGSVAINNYIHHNDRAGLKISGGGALVQNNELSYNNYRNLEDPLWDVGGVKLAWDGVGNIVKDNWAHHNNGAGIWFDIDNNDAIVENNLVEDNSHVGIVTEISQGTIIRNNTVNRNGLVYGPQIKWGWGNGIQVQSAKNIEIYNNELNGNYNGIFIVENGRGYGFNNVDVYNNTVKNSVHWAAGAVEGGSGGPFGLFNANVRFRNNTYIGNPTNAWAWKSNGITFSAWQANGQDINGSSN